MPVETVSTIEDQNENNHEASNAENGETVKKQPESQAVPKVCCLNY